MFFDSAVAFTICLNILPFLGFYQWKWKRKWVSEWVEKMYRRDDVCVRVCVCVWNICSRKGVCLKFARVDFGSRIKRSELAKSVFPRQDNLPRKYVIRLQRLLKQDGIWQRINPRLKVSKNELGKILLLAGWLCFFYFFALFIYSHFFFLFLLSLTSLVSIYFY